MYPNGDIVTPNPDAGNGNNSGDGFDGFGGPNISYESFNSPEEQAKIDTEKKPEEVTISLTNANGVVSGRPTVDYSWKNIAKALMGVSAIFLVGMVISVVICVMQINNATQADKEKQNTKSQISQLYELIGADDQVSAAEALSLDKQYMNGSDFASVDKLLTARFGSNYVIDYDESNINFLKINGKYKVLSLGIVQVTGTKRVVLYQKIASGEWVMGKFNTNELKPCADVEGDEAEAIKGIIDCETLQEEIDEEQKEAAKSSEQKKTDDKETKTDDETKTEE